MSDFEDVTRYVSENREMVIQNLQAEREAIGTSLPLKILESRYLFPFWDGRANRNMHFAFKIHETELEKLNLAKVKKSLYGDIQEILKRYCVLSLDRNFSILEHHGESVIKEELTSESETKQVVTIFFTPEGIDFAIRGRLLKDITLFFSEEERNKYKKLPNISELIEIIKNYQVHINQPGTNEVFFERSKHFNTLPGRHNNLLVNKPEKIMRNNLLGYLNANTQHTFTKETELNSKRELDLYTEANGKHYLIEVKWMGKSLNDEGNGISSTNYTDGDMRSGVIQTLEYIEELAISMQLVLHCGYLCIFDARDNKTPVDYKEFEFINKKPNLLPYYEQHFSLLDNIALDCIR